MSEYRYCKIGGMDGIRVSDEELSSLADAMNTKYIDQYIPLPHLTTEQQKAMLNVCNNHDDDQYWERDNGKHGWCCGKCGTVTQWG